MDVTFTIVPYQGNLPQDLPKGSAIYKIFDTRGQLIVLDRTSNLAQRLERFFGERSEPVRDLDLREITSRIEFRRTYSPFETTYLLYLERRRLYPRTYRKMRTFRLFSLMKVSRKQRFPRIYASRQIKAGVDYFGPFVSRGQFTRLKTTLERTFRLRPCLYNIRGNDPHPDCMYFQMHTCSRPCNNDITRSGYLEDVESAIAFIQGEDQKLESSLMSQIEALSSEEKFEEAELARRRFEKLRSARQDVKDTFPSLWAFDYLAVLPSDSVARTRIAFVRSGNIVELEDYAVESLRETLPQDLARVYAGPAPARNREWQYDEFCLVAGFLVDPLKSVELVRVSPGEDLARGVDLVGLVETRLRAKKRTATAPTEEDATSFR